jgi:isoleucyl-tRNA synthetase
VLAFWERDDTFRASIAQREGAEEWVFYDGPPFANGLPHYGHLLTGYAKDLFPRFQTMRGKKVDRVFGWDTHGLPAELEAMKQLGITEKSEIEQMGIAPSTRRRSESVLEYTQQWEDYVTRQARWVDFERGYKTLDTGYMESVLWAFKTCGTRASPTRATACCRTAGATRPPCRTTSCAWTTTSTRCGRTRRSPSRSRSSA